MKRKVTLKQIAKELDVSVSTVSKALRNSKEISLDTRSKVQAFAKLYNYRPNNIALSLKNKRTKTIGVIIPEIVHHFFSKVISGIEKEANNRGYNVIIGLSNESFDKEVINIEMLANGSIDGFILSVAKETLLLQDYHHFYETINQGMPIVMFDRVVNEIACDKVVVDDKLGSKKAVAKLIESGCENIALITTKDYVNVGKLRTQGYLEALEEHKIEPKASLIIKAEENKDKEVEIETLEKEISALLEKEKAIDGIFAVNELYAITAMKIAINKGYKIPEDISIIAFTDGVLSKHAIPSLSTISQHAVEMGEKSATMLIDKLEELTDEEEYQTQVINTTLIERDTTR
ncbi:LacI family DNA-binding transcriptional regulator [Kordia sp.]|uniref:LacI family DNA-binding transcriptional regulator n=1 Tax=Kordia sp. TaxID=1965332 RepID=UPI0025C4E812|nr:LacI family DNA-binding transcriptional regulator [Kordia sp.]MCH2192744.1 LacI family transcriptional regulator [Kordia sp.]MCH2232503.1 LacI family transcriptional regulator [Crocinitomicaceae bacterium]